MAVSKANSNNKQIDDDSLKHKEGIHRTRDTMPPYKKETPASQNKPKQPLKNTIPVPGKKKPTPAKDAPAEPADTKQKRSEIPKFDLAEEIMAEQRKITAIRRKAPGQKTEAQNEERQAESIGRAIEQPPAALSEQEQIIAEIVARDIEKLCRGGTSGIQRQEFKDTDKDVKRNPHRQS